MKVWSEKIIKYGLTIIFSNNFLSISTCKQKNIKSSKTTMNWVFSWKPQLKSNLIIKFCQW